MAKKRILSILLCLLVALPLIALPAFATGVGTGGAMYPVLAWNTVSKGTSFQNQTEFAGRFLRQGNAIETTTSSLMDQVTSTSSTDYTGHVEFYTGAGNRNLSFIGRDFVLELNRLDTLYIRATDNEYDCDVVVTGQIGVMNLVGNYWRMVDYPISVRCRASQLLNEFKRVIADKTTTNVVYVRNLEFACSYTGDEYDGVWFYSSSYVSNPPSLSTFLGQQPMKYQNIVTVDPADPSDTSFVDWLVVGVGGFLQFELWDGFTLNQLIEFVVVIGLVLWFITLLI